MDCAHNIRLYTTKFKNHACSKALTLRASGMLTHHPVDPIRRKYNWTTKRLRLKRENRLGSMPISCRKYWNWLFSLENAKPQQSSCEQREGGESRKMERRGQRRDELQQWGGKGERTGWKLGIDLTWGLDAGRPSYGGNKARWFIEI